MNSLFTDGEKLFVNAMFNEINADAILRTVTKKLFTGKTTGGEEGVNKSACRSYFSWECAYTLTQHISTTILPHGQWFHTRFCSKVPFGGANDFAI